jgi:hypothetical protein
VSFLHQIFIHQIGNNPILQGLAGGFVIASLNMIGALSVLVWRNPCNLDNAMPLMLAIGIQNVPEGLAVSVAALNAGLVSLFYAAITNIRAGLVEIPWRSSGLGRSNWPNRSSHTRWASLRAR